MKLVAFGFLVTVAAFGGPLDIPDGDPLTTLLNLVMNFKAMSPVVVASAVIMLVVQGVKKFVPDFKYLKLLAVFGGVVYATLQSMSSGLALTQALAFVLLSSGGAVLIYEALKEQINSLFQVKQ